MNNWRVDVRIIHEEDEVYTETYYVEAEDPERAKNIAVGEARSWHPGAQKWRVAEISKSDPPFDFNTLDKQLAQLTIMRNAAQRLLPEILGIPVMGVEETAERSLTPIVREVLEETRADPRVIPSLESSDVYKELFWIYSYWVSNAQSTFADGLEAYLRTYDRK